MRSKTRSSKKFGTQTGLTGRMAGTQKGLWGEPLTGRLPYRGLVAVPDDEKLIKTHIERETKKEEEGGAFAFKGDLPVKGGEPTMRFNGLMSLKKRQNKGE